MIIYICKRICKGIEMHFKVPDHLFYFFCLRMSLLFRRHIDIERCVFILLYIVF